MTATNEVTTADVAPGYDPALERRIAEMRALLEAMRPASSAEALRVLRARFPENPLDERVTAASGWVG
jgi:alkylation response protein AidB-like acyl-CoA dehydrogenase